MRLAFALLLAASSRAADWDARITAVKGKVSVIPVGQGMAIPAKNGYPLRSGDRITTGFASSCEIALDAGRLIALRPESELLLKSLDQGASELWLPAGSILARIKTLLELQALSIRTPHALAAVRGTKLGVEAARREGDKAYVAVFDEGVVEVDGEAGASVTIEANQETTVVEKAAPTAPTELKRFARLVDSMAAVTSRARYVAERWQPYDVQKREQLRREAETSRERSQPRQVLRRKP